MNRSRGDVDGRVVGPTGRRLRYVTPCPWKTASLPGESVLPGQGVIFPR